jgi:ABC-2 type transport system permease protein
VGIALVGVTQFILWAALTFGINTIAQKTFLKDINQKIDRFEMAKEEVFTKGADLSAIADAKKDPSEAIDFFKGFRSIDFTQLALIFLFYFTGGYLLYSALFAAVGAAVDNEADTQQFMLPITIPLIFSFVVAQSVVQNPESSLSFWCSIFPLTSPVTMMIRIPFGVPAWELALSMVLLVLGFLGTTWLAGRIYRTGILMYGKKPSWKELGKWLFYKS